MKNIPGPIYNMDPRNIQERDESYKEIAKYFKSVRGELLEVLKIQYSVENYRDFIKRFSVEIRGEFDSYGWTGDSNHSLIYKDKKERESEIALVTERVDKNCALTFSFLKSNLANFLD